MKRIALLSMLAAATVVAAADDLRLAAIFRDNMVLQREMPVPVWGWTQPGTQVSVAFAGQNKKAEAGEDGRWQVTLDPLQANATGKILQVKAGTDSLSRENILVGEIWLAVGQSNMNSEGPDRDTGLYPHYAPFTGDRPEIRIVRNFATWHASLDPVADLDPTVRDKVVWKTMPENPSAAAGFSLKNCSSALSIINLSPLFSFRL